MQAVQLPLASESSTENVAVVNLPPAYRFKAYVPPLLWADMLRVLRLMAPHHASAGETLEALKRRLREALRQGNLETPNRKPDLEALLAALEAYSQAASELVGVCGMGVA